MGTPVHNGKDSSQSTHSKREPDRAFAARVEAIVTRVGGTAELARRTKLSKRMIDKYRNGGAEPSRESLIALAEGGGVSLSWLATGDGGMLESAGGHTQKGELRHRVLSIPATLDAPPPGEDEDDVDEFIRQLSYPAAIRVYGRAQVSVDAVMTAVMQHAREVNWGPEKLAKVARLRRTLEDILEPADESRARATGEASPGSG